MSKGSQGIPYCLKLTSYFPKIPIESECEKIIDGIYILNEKITHLFNRKYGSIVRIHFLSTDCSEKFTKYICDFLYEFKIDDIKLDEFCNNHFRISSFCVTKDEHLRMIDSIKKFKMESCYKIVIEHKTYDTEEDLKVLQNILKVRGRKVSYKYDKSDTKYKFEVKVISSQYKMSYRNNKIELIENYFGKSFGGFRKFYYQGTVLHGMAKSVRFYVDTRENLDMILMVILENGEKVEIIKYIKDDSDMEEF